MERMIQRGVLPAIVVAMVLASCGGSDNQEGSASPEVTETSRSEPGATGASGATATTGATGPTQTIGDARELVDEDDFPAALVIAAALGGNAEKTIGRRIANRIGQRATAAIRRGNRGGARRILRAAGDYPATRAVVSARTQLRSSEERATTRRRAAAAQREQDRAAAAERKRQAKEAAAAPAQPEAPDDTPSVPSGTCAETSMTDFAVPPGDPRDRDGDGIACES